MRPPGFVHEGVAVDAPADRGVEAAAVLQADEEFGRCDLSDITDRDFELALAGDRLFAEVIAALERALWDEFFRECQGDDGGLLDLERNLPRIDLGGILEDDLPIEAVEPALLGGERFSEIDLLAAVW